MRMRKCIAAAVFAAFLLMAVARADEIGALETDANSWISQAQSLYRLDCESMAKIWEAYCGVASFGNHEEYDVDFARETAKQLQSPEQSTLESLMSAYTDSGKLKDRAQAFKEQPETQSKADQLLEAMNKEFDKLQRLKDGLVLRGSDHPFVQYSIDYGKTMHDHKNSDLGCTVYDREYGNGRPDCVKVSGDGCWVYEFKPPSSRAVDAGKEKLRGQYVPDVEKYYQMYIDSHGDSYPDSNHGGKEIIQKINETSKCWEGPKVKFKSEVVTYDRCDKRYTCVE